MTLKSMTIPQRVLCAVAAAALIAVLVFTEKVCLNGRDMVVNCFSNHNLAPQYDVNALLVRGLAVLVVTFLLGVAIQRRGE